MGACLFLVAGLATAAPARGQQETVVPPEVPPLRWAVFVHPTPTLIVATMGDVYVSMGAAIALTERTELVVEGTFTHGSWFGCASTSTGGWGAAGAAIYFDDSRKGFFLLPKLVVRVFDTSGGENVSGPFGCSEGTNVNGVDYELHVGLDVGYRFRAGPVVITPVFGVSAGFCGNCIRGGPFYVGDVSFDLSNDPGRRIDRASLGLNLNVIRIGVGF